MREHTIAIGDLPLDDGSVLSAVEQRVTIYGTPASDGSNVVLVPHALTGSSRVAEWWAPIAGTGGLFNSEQWCVVGINALGGCYGSTGPAQRSAFPKVTVRDIVRAQRRTLDALGLARIACAIGGSLGGMQALQWALDAPECVGEAIVVGAHDHMSAMGIAQNAVQRECLELDPVRGLGTARKLAMLTYKSEELLTARHGRNRASDARFEIEGYLDHQAHKFQGRMDAATYATLTHAMDSFDVRDALPHAASPPLLFVGISSDRLFRAQDVRTSARRFAARGFDARYAEMQSAHGHDAFLAEAAQLAELVRDVIRDSSRKTFRRSSSRTQ